MWDYLTRTVNTNQDAVGASDTFPEEMDKLGEEGWELVAVSTIQNVEKFYFKRESPDPGQPTAPGLKIESMTPDTGPVSINEIDLTVSGIGFASDSVIVFDGEPQDTVFQTVVELTARVKPKAPVAGPVPVLVRNTLFDSNTVQYTFA
jgi:hypothetical protein